MADPQSRLSDIVYRLEKDMYYGNGKPGITTRMAAMEKCIEDLQEAEETRVAKAESAEKEKREYRVRVEIAVWSTLIAIIADIVFKHR